MYEYAQASKQTVRQEAVRQEGKSTDEHTYIQSAIYKASHLNTIHHIQLNYAIITDVAAVAVVTAVGTPHHSVQFHSNRQLQNRTNERTNERTNKRPPAIHPASHTTIHPYFDSFQLTLTLRVCIYALWNYNLLTLYALCNSMNMYVCMYIRENAWQNVYVAGYMDGCLVGWLVGWLNARMVICVIREEYSLHTTCIPIKSN